MLKKMISAFLAITAVLLLAACGDVPNVPTGEQTTDAATHMSQTTEPTESAPIKSELGVGERDDYGEETEPTEPQTPVTDATEPKETEPKETEPDSTEPTSTEPEGTTSTEGEEPKVLTFAEYEAMSLEEQEAFVASFETLQDFIDWWNAAKEAEKNDEEIITGDPTIDLGELIPKN